MASRESTEKHISEIRAAGYSRVEAIFVENTLAEAMAESKRAQDEREA